MGAFVENVVEQPASLKITLSSDRLDFGDLAVDAEASRHLIVRNDEEKPLRAEILVDDSRYRVSPEQMILHPGVGARVRVDLIGSKAGTLEHELRIVIDKADSAPLVVALAGRITNEPSVAVASAARNSDSESGANARSTQQKTRRNFARSGTDPDGQTAAASDAASMTVTVTDASAQGDAQAGSAGTTPNPSANVNTETRRPTANPTPNRAEQPAQAQATGQRGASFRVTSNTAGSGVPIRSIADRPAPISDTITPADAQTASRIPSKVPGGNEGELPDTLPEEPEFDREEDLFDREDDDEPFQAPTLTISGQSTVRIMGSHATFYPQQISVMGTNAGGSLSLTRQVEFPMVPLAFGESMLFAQTLPGASGGFDPVSGQVTLELPIQAVDVDGDAAPINLILTTGTAVERNESGNVVSMTGSPRVPQTGILRLVGLAKIPVGFRNGGEQHLAVFEILASLSFGNSIALSDPTPIGRIGG